MWKEGRTRKDNVGDYGQTTLYTYTKMSKLNLSFCIINAHQFTKEIEFFPHVYSMHTLFGFQDSVF